ncbi:trichohyalin [Drosophila ficusphila]|uniref:trichohyalin n=1 Tax=Drosophila ficusphila TaxID=30025 RepID=UPI001C8A3511|nr:trichohyalin [Drosophila ficusphila]
MTNKKSYEHGVGHQKRRVMEDRLERSYRQKVRIIRCLTARQSNAKDFDLCAKWMYVFSRTSKEEARARDYLLGQMLSQLRDAGSLSLPFTNLANCSLDLHLLLDEEGRKLLHRSSPRQLVAQRGSNLARRRRKPTPFEWRQRVEHLDHLENQYRREEQETWSLDFPSEGCLTVKSPPKRQKLKKRSRTFGTQGENPVTPPRAARDLCERERKQREILLRRERADLERKLREQKRERQRTLLAEEQQLERQRLEKARRVLDRRMREQQLKVKERRDHERYLLLKKREEQRLQDQRWRAQRRPITPSSQDVENPLPQSEEPEHMSHSKMTVPANSDASKSASREQQLQLRAENAKQKVLAYEQLKEFHRERAQSERDRQLKMRQESRRNRKEKVVVEPKKLQKSSGKEDLQKDLQQGLEKSQQDGIERKRLQELKALQERQEKEEQERKYLAKKLEQERLEREDFERKREEELKSLKERQEWEEKERMELQKRLETERKEREEFERRTCEEHKQKEKKIEDLKRKLNEVHEREVKRNEELEREARQKQDLEKRKQDEREESAEEEELLRERRILEKLRLSKSARELLEQKTREEDLKREQILRRRLHVQEQQEKKEAEEREERQKKLVKECEKKIQEEANIDDQAKKQEGREDTEKPYATDKKDLNLPRREELRTREETLEQKEERWRRIKEDRLLVEQKQEEKLRRDREKLDQEEKDRDSRLQQLRQRRNQERQLENETRDVAKTLRNQLEKHLELHENYDLRQKRSEEKRLRKDLENLEKTIATESRYVEVQAAQEAQELLDRMQDLVEIQSQECRRKSNSESQNMLVEEAQKTGEEDKRIYHPEFGKEETKLKNVSTQFEKLQERNKKLNEQVLEGRQVLAELRMAAGELAKHNPLSSLSRKTSLKNILRTPEEKRSENDLMASSSREYFMPRSFRTRSERWARFIGSEEASEEEEPGFQGRNQGRSSSDLDADPNYSLVGSYCPRKKIYTVERQTISTRSNGYSGQMEAYGSYVRKRVAEWRKTLRPSSYSTDEEQPEGEEKRESGGETTGPVHLTYCTQTGTMRYPMVKKHSISQGPLSKKKRQDTQLQAFVLLLTGTHISDYDPETLSTENGLLQRKLSEGQALAARKHSLKSIIQVVRHLSRIFKNEDADVSSEEENDCHGKGALDQIHLQETKTKMKLPRPIFQTTLVALFPPNNPFHSHLVEKMAILDSQLEMHLKKTCNWFFARRGGKDLRRKVEELVEQQRQAQTCQLAEMCRNSEEQTLRQWRRLARNSLLGMRSLFHDYCDMHDALPCSTLQTIERLYIEWKERRCTVD